MDFRSGDRAARYLFFFGYSSNELRQKMGGKGVTLLVAHETTPFNYERLETTADKNIPDLIEVGYLPEEETFICRVRGGGVMKSRVEMFCKDFIEQVTKREF